MKIKTLFGAGVIVLAVAIPARAEISREKIAAFCEARTFVAASLYKAFPVIADHLLLSEKLLIANKKWLIYAQQFATSAEIHIERQRAWNAMPTDTDGAMWCLSNAPPEYPT